MATFGSRNPLNSTSPQSSLRKAAAEAPVEFVDPQLPAKFESLLIGQPGVAQKILPFVQMYQSGLCPEGRPAGVFLLLGPTGTGKTRTVEALAECLHGSSKNYLRVDCGEFQMEHEVAKLVGSPPGYLGHRETQPLLSNARLQSTTSERSQLSILLFDEIEKAAGSLVRMLLGVLDRGILRLGDNSLANFENTIIFMTSNLGAEAMQKELVPKLGFQAIQAKSNPESASEITPKLESIAMASARKKFSPEFMNRIDAVHTYLPLDEKAMTQILDLQVAAIQRHIITKLGANAFRLRLTPRLRRFLLERGVSREYGARELKRTLQRYVLQPLAAVVTSGKATPGSCLLLDIQGEDRIQVRKRQAAD
jgi:ATP-dependent Clp protease ATP-binding subunit ClpA